MYASSGEFGAKRVYVEHHGCSSNRFDLEIMLAYLTEAGYEVTNDPAVADVILVNTCGVKKPTEDKILQRLRSLAWLEKPIVIAGCLPRINLDSLIDVLPEFSAMMDPRSIDTVVLAIQSALAGEKNKFFFSEKPIAKLRQPKIRLNPSVEIVLISEGCVGACAFCCVRLARNGFLSYPKVEIVNSLRKAVSEGVKEVWLTSQDCGAYGLGAKTTLAELIRECCMVEGQFLLRVGMMNPNHVLRMLPELIDAYKDSKVFKFLHLPLQSGNDETLRHMNRFYRVQEFKEIVEAFRKEIPDITLATDIICGFPDESRDAFEDTLELLEAIGPETINVSRFFPRPWTKAEKMAQLSNEEINYRSRKLTRLARKITAERNRKWLNWQGKILVDEKGKGSSWIGRNFAYKPIVIRSNENLLGRNIDAKIIKSYSTYLEAEAINLH